MKKKIIKYKIGEEIKIISGKYKNNIGKIKKILHKQNAVIIDKINIKTKHLKPKQNEEKGQIIQIEAHIHSSNIKKYITNT